MYPRYDIFILWYSVGLPMTQTQVLFGTWCAVIIQSIVKGLAFTNGTGPINNPLQEGEELTSMSSPMQHTQRTRQQSQNPPQPAVFY